MGSRNVRTDLYVPPNRNFAEAMQLAHLALEAGFPSSNVRPECRFSVPHEGTTQGDAPSLLHGVRETQALERDRHPDNKALWGNATLGSPYGIEPRVRRLALGSDAIPLHA